MITKTSTKGQPQVLIQYIELSVVKYKGEECVSHFVELFFFFFWDKSVTIPSLLAHMWL